MNPKKDNEGIDDILKKHYGSGLADALDDGVSISESNSEQSDWSFFIEVNNETSRVVARLKTKTLKGILIVAIIAGFAGAAKPINWAIQQFGDKTRKHEPQSIQERKEAEMKARSINIER